MKFLLSIVRVKDLDDSVKLFRESLGFIENKRRDYPDGKFTLVYLGAPENPEVEVELTFNYDTEDYGTARNFGHLAFEVDDIYAACQRLQNAGVDINRPPRDGRMAFVRSPDLISIELLQKGGALPPQEPWASMPNTGVW